MRSIVALTPRALADPGLPFDLTSGRAISIARSTQADWLAVALTSAEATAGATVRAAPARAEAPSAAARPRLRVEDIVGSSPWRHADQSGARRYTGNGNEVMPNRKETSRDL